MSPLGVTLVMLNNYVHDVATGLLLLSALWLGWTSRDLGDRPSPEVVEVFRRGYRRCLRFVVGSCAFIAVTGAVRAKFFMRVEWTPAAGGSFVEVLIAKHVLFAVLLGAGIYAWVNLRRRLRTLPGWSRSGKEKDDASAEPVRARTGG